MAETMNAVNDPRVFEHVTKMGRVGQNSGITMSNPRGQLQFRPLPFQMSASSSSRKTNSTVSEEPIVTVPIHSQARPNVISPQRDTRQSGREPYEEMKLGRNMRAAPRGAIGPRSVASHSNTQLDSQPCDDCEPLLRNAPSSNIIVDYFTNTRSGLTSTTGGGVSILSHTPSRTITNPQHPSQDLIEMLNRNRQITVTRETELESRSTTDREARNSAAEKQQRLEAELQQLRNMEQQRAFGQRPEPVNLMSPRREPVNISPRMAPVNFSSRSEPVSMSARSEPVNFSPRRTPVNLSPRQEPVSTLQQTDSSEDEEVTAKVKERLHALRQHDNDIQRKDQLLQESFPLSGVASPPVPPINDLYSLSIQRDTTPPESPKHSESLPLLGNNEDNEDVICESIEGGSDNENIKDDDFDF